jgi:H+/Cl- antiporter ClcA
MEVVIEFGKILIPASIVVYLSYLLVRSFIQKEIQVRSMEIRGGSSQSPSSLRKDDLVP